MCGCEQHHDDAAPCSCICPEHGNFNMAYNLAVDRGKIIRDLNSQVELLRDVLIRLVDPDNGWAAYDEYDLGGSGALQIDAEISLTMGELKFLKDLGVLKPERRR